MFKAITARDWFRSTYRTQQLLSAAQSTIDDYESMFNRIDESLGRELLLVELDDEHAADYLFWYRQQGRALATVEKHRRYLHALANYAASARQKAIPEPLSLRRIKAPKREPLAWSEEEMEVLLEHAAALKGTIEGVPRGAWWEALLCVILYCGVRITPAMRLRWQDVYMSEKYALFRAENQKQAADQTLPFPEFAAERLAAIRYPERALVFPWPYDRNQRTWRTLQRHFAKYILKPAGLAHDRKSKFHRIRKTTATQLTNWVSEEAAVRVMGHSSPQVTRESYIDRSKSRGPRPCDALPIPRYKRPNGQRMLFD